MERIGLTGLIKIELPTRDVLLCDGGFKVWGGDTYISRDPVFGVITSLEGIEEGLGDEVPALELELAPPSGAAVADLSQPGYQTARARFWTAEFDPDTDAIVGDPQLDFDGQVDQTTLRVGRTERILAITIVSTAERLFQRNIGNSLSPSFHKTLFPGELGHDNATGLKLPIAWGVASPPRAVGTSAGSGSGGGGGFGQNGYNVVRQ
jgi:hypothetical protein